MKDRGADYWEGRCHECAHPAHPMTCHEIVGASPGPIYCQCAVMIDSMEAEIVSLRKRLAHEVAAAHEPEPGLYIGPIEHDSFQCERADRCGCWCDACERHNARQPWELLAINSDGMAHIMMRDWLRFGEVHVTNADGFTRLDPKGITYSPTGDEIVARHEGRH